MFQVLRNFTTSLETRNASFALNWVDMIIVLLGRNISGYRNWYWLLSVISLTLLCWTVWIISLCVFCDLMYHLKKKRLWAGFPDWPILGQTSEIWACLKLVGVKKFWLFFLHRKSFLWTEVLLFHLFRQRFCTIFVINAIVDRRQRSCVGKIWWMRSSKWIFA